MADREKVIKALEKSIDANRNIGLSTINMSFEAVEVLIELLKEQEAVVPDVDSEGTCTCGNCGENVGYYPVGSKVPEKLCKYCPECGRAVKLDA